MYLSCLTYNLWVEIFCVFPIVSSAAVSVGVHVSFWMVVFLEYNPGVGMSDPGLTFLKL